jgi:hypothetical protein
MTHLGNATAVSRTRRARETAIMASAISFRHAVREDARRGHVSFAWGREQALKR